MLEAGNFGFTRRGRRRLQQPARHVYRDAHCALLQKALHGPEVLPAEASAAHGHNRWRPGAGSGKRDWQPGGWQARRRDRREAGLASFNSSSVDLASAMVYSAQASDVETVVIDGQLVMKDGRLLTLDERSVVRDANRESVLSLLKRAGIEA